MSTSNSSQPRIYLAKNVESDELVLKQGVNPNALKRAGSRILVIGGGVTGLTVRIISCLYIPACMFTDDSV